MLLYYITDRTQFAGTDAEQRKAMLRKIAEAASAGVDLIQVREKDLPIAELEKLGHEAVRAVRDHSDTTRLLINSRTDLAIAVGADGVHLTSSDISASDGRAIWAASIGGHGPSTAFTIGVSCHSVDEVRSAESHGADFAVLGPIFEKSGTTVTPLGLDAIRTVTKGRKPDMRVEAGDNRADIPVLALGGVNLTNARLCLEAGAAGIAGIRLFQVNDVKEVVKALRQA